MSTTSDLSPASSSWACLHLNQALEVSALDAQARALLDGTKGLLQVHRHRLVSAQGQAALDKALNQALGGQVGALTLHRTSGGHPLTLRCEPHHKPRGVRVTVRDAAVEQACVQCLRELFGLTHAEASVTAWLAHGLRSNDIAERMGIQPNTVLAHLKKVLAKTGTPHQVALLALVLRSVAMLHSDHAHQPRDPIDAPAS